MLRPKKTKYRKVQKGRNRGLASRCNALNIGKFGLKALQCGRIDDKQIESIRVIFTRILEKTGKMWIRVFPDKPITKKPAEVRMGSGKGDVDHYAAPIKPGTVIIEVDGVSRDVAIDASRSAGKKLPFKTKFIESRESSRYL